MEGLKCSYLECEEIPFFSCMSCSDHIFCSSHIGTHQNHMQDGTSKLFITPKNLETVRLWIDNLSRNLHTEYKKIMTNLTKISKCFKDSLEALRCLVAKVNDLKKFSNHYSDESFAHLAEKSSEIIQCIVANPNYFNEFVNKDFQTFLNELKPEWKEKELRVKELSDIEVPSFLRKDSDEKYMELLKRLEILETENFKLKSKTETLERKVEETTEAEHKANTEVSNLKMKIKALEKNQPQHIIKGLSQEVAMESAPPLLTEITSNSTRSKLTRVNPYGSNFQSIEKPERSPDLLTAELKDKEKALKDSNEKNAHLNKQLLELQEELRNLDFTLSTKEKLLEDANQQIRDSEERYMELLKSLEILETENSKLKSKTETLERKVEETTEAEHKANSEVSNLKMKIKALEKNQPQHIIKSLSQEVAMESAPPLLTEIACNSTRPKLKPVNPCGSNFQSIEKPERSPDLLTAELKDMEKALKDSNEKNAHLNKQLLELQEELRNLDFTLSTKEKLLEDANQQIVNINSVLSEIECFKQILGLPANLGGHSLKFKQFEFKSSPHEGFEYTSSSLRIMTFFNREIFTQQGTSDQLIPIIQVLDECIRGIFLSENEKILLVLYQTAAVLLERDGREFKFIENEVITGATPECYFTRDNKFCVIVGETKAIIFNCVENKKPLRIRLK